MTLSRTFSFYIVRQFLLAIIGIFVACLVLVYIVDLSELLRRAGTREGVGFTTVAAMAFFKLPGMAERLFPFAVLFGSMIAFLRLSRRQELIVARSAGISAWQFIAPATAAVFLLGVGVIAVYNPIAAGFNAVFERMDATYLRGRGAGSIGAIEGGLWLRQANNAGAAIVHAEKGTNQGLELFGVIVFQFGEKDEFLSRVDAERATFEQGRWRLENAWITRPDDQPVFAEEHWVDTSLSRTQVAESLASPSAISFWDLPNFIEIAEKAGLSADRYRVHYQFLLAQPALLCSMVLVAATFSLRLFRLGHVTRMVVGGILVGFALFLANHISRALGGSGVLPAFVAAWWPAVIASLASLTVLFYQEDG